MSVWFEGNGEIACELQRVERALDDPGKHFAEVTALMPGMTTVELVEQDPDSVTIRTNEGIMTRTRISKRIAAERLTIEFDEKYEAGSKITTTSHFSHEFTTTDTGVAHRLVMSNVQAPGFLGFFYRNFGSSKTGNALLTAYRAYFEKQSE